MTSTVPLLQPALSVLWSVTMLSEPVDWPQAIGVVLVLGGIVVAYQVTTTQPEQMPAWHQWRLALFRLREGYRPSARGSGL